MSPYNTKIEVNSLSTDSSNLGVGSLCVYLFRVHACEAATQFGVMQQESSEHLTAFFAMDAIR